MYTYVEEIFNGMTMDGFLATVFYLDTVKNVYFKMCRNVYWLVVTSKHKQRTDVLWKMQICSSNTSKKENVYLQRKFRNSQRSKLKVKMLVFCVVDSYAMYAFVANMWKRSHTITKPYFFGDWPLLFCSKLIMFLCTTHKKNVLLYGRNPQRCSQSTTK